MAKPSYQRPAWEDQFTVPCHRALREGYTNKHNAELFECALTALRSLPNVTEKLAWHGVPWCWSFVYENGCRDGAPAAMLVPDVHSPKIVVPMPAGTFHTVKLDDLAAEIKDIIAHSRSVCGGAWPAFEITGKTRLEAVVNIIRRRIVAAHMAKQNGAPSGSGNTGFIPPHPMR